MIARDTLARVVRGDLPHWLTGCDHTPAIVCVDADDTGHARVWQRAGARVECVEQRFPNWFLITSLEMLAHLPVQVLAADALRRAHGALGMPEPDGITVVRLDPPAATHDPEDAYQYLVLTDRLDELETVLIETWNKRDGDDAQTLADLRGLVLTCHPIEQFLILTGRTYYKDLEYGQLRRLQFDLETTGLDENRDRIFMVSLRDSLGWHDCLDIGAMSEAELIERFVRSVQERDPDVLENHNIFAFDLPFLVKRAAHHGIPLALGRDGSEPRLESDVYDNGERGEPFLRWRIAGREVVDTQHAVRRYGTASPDLRRHGLKDAARYFGFAKVDREYVPGADVWPTYRTDPDRIRRYATDDVDEVDGLSRRLLPASVGLARIVPRAYERIVADASPAAMWQPLLVRAYLHEARAIPAPLVRQQRPSVRAHTELFVRGVVGPAGRATLRRLLPSVVARKRLCAGNDDLALMPKLLELLLDRDDDASTTLAEAGPAYLAGQGLFSDPNAASMAFVEARRHVDRLARDLREHGCSIVEIDGEHVLFSTAADWDERAEQAAIERARAYAPPGVELTFSGRYAALYARGPRNAMMLAADGSLTLVGSTLRPGRLERFGEAFMHRAAPLALRGDAAGLRAVFLEMLHQLRTAQIALEDLSVQVTLHKAPHQYRRGGTVEEPYEVLQAAGVRTWRVGQRIRYFRARSGGMRLLQEGGVDSAEDADTEYYAQRLSNLYAQQFAHAFRKEDLARIFALPAGPGPYPFDPESLANIHTITTPA